MSCRVIRPLISAYLDHQLNPTQMHMVEQHLTFCSRCDEEYQAVRDAKYALRSLASRNPDELALRIAARLQAENARPQPYGHPPLPASLVSTRRTVTAVAFSCLCLFLVAVPFAPATLERYETWRNARSPRNADPFNAPILTWSSLAPGMSSFRSPFQNNRPRRYTNRVEVRTVTFGFRDFTPQPFGRNSAQPVYGVQFAGDTDPGWASPR